MLSLHLLSRKGFSIFEINGNISCESRKLDIHVPIGSSLLYISHIMGFPYITKTYRTLIGDFDALFERTSVREQSDKYCFFLLISLNLDH